MKKTTREPDRRLSRSDWAEQGRCGFHRRLEFGADGFREGHNISNAHTRANDLSSVRFCSCQNPQFGKVAEINHTQTQTKGVL